MLLRGTIYSNRWVCALGSRLDEAFVRSARFTIEQLFERVSFCRQWQGASIKKSTNRWSLYSGRYYDLVSRAVESH